MKKQSAIKNIIVILFLAALLVGSFMFLSNRERKLQESVVKITPVQEVLLINIEKNYPVTPKEVVKLYSEITRCYYSEEYTDEELIKLAELSRKLFDDELRANQSDDQYLANLNTVIEAYKKEKRVISSYSVAGSVNTEYYDYDGREWAKLGCVYNVRTGKQMENSKETFLLRKDDKGKWKIFGWQIDSTEEM